MLTYSFYESDNRVRRYAETLVRRGDSVDVISLRRKGENVYNELNGVRIQRVQERVRDEKGKLDYLSRILKFFVRSASLLTYRHLRNPYEIVHVHSVPDFEVFAALVPKLMGARVILDIHDIVPELYSSKFKVGKSSMIFKLLLLAERMSIGFSDHVIISNDIWRERLLSRSVSGRKCTSILNYPDERLFFTGGCKKTRKPVFMYPGTLNHHQGLDLAIEAFAQIKDVVPQAEFHIFGDGPARKSLEGQIRTKGLKGRVFLLDPVPLDRIVNLMANADIGVIPKKNDDFGGEAFSTKTLEFMSLGVPIILSRTRIDRFYFSEDVVKFFEPGSSNELAAAMLEMVRDKALRERLAAKGQEFARKNSWETKKHTYLNLIGDLAFKNTESDLQVNQQT
jgi:glycosyltransferase involved in cell wall biosynthesis